MTMIARLSKDGGQVKCSSCGAELASILRRFAGPQRGAVDELRLPPGWQAGDDGVWGPPAESEVEYRVRRAVASGQHRLPPRYAAAARDRLREDPPFWVNTPVPLFRLPIRVRCLRCRAENELARELYEHRVP